MSTLDEMAAYLEGHGVGTVGTDLFKGKRPDNPDDIMVIYEYPGNVPEYVQDSFTPKAERPQLQFLARSKDYETARLNAARMWSAVCGITNADLSGTRYRYVRPNGSPGLIGHDSDDRSLVAFNASVEKAVNLVPVS